MKLNHQVIKMKTMDQDSSGNGGIGMGNDVADLGIGLQPNLPHPHLE